MKLQEDELLHLTDPMLGVCALKRKLVHRVTTATLPTLNGLATQANLTKEEALFNYLGNVTVTLLVMKVCCDQRLIRLLTYI